MIWHGWVDGSPLWNQRQVFVTKVTFQVGGHPLGFDLQNDSLCNVYFAQHMLHMNEYLLRHEKQTGQGLSTLQPRPSHQTDDNINYYLHLYIYHFKI